MVRKLIKTGLAIALSMTLANANEVLKGEIVESIDASGYTYVKVKTADNMNQWAAIMQGNYKVGSQISINQEMKTQNFTSKTLGVTFDSIVFGKVAKDKMAEPKQDVIYKDSEIVKTDIKSLLEKSSTFKDKVVQAKGKVVKVSTAIMKTNWIHLEDENKNKIIFRSLKDNVEVGQTVTATGKADTNVDYGYGYKYDIIVLDSVFK